MQTPLTNKQNNQESDSIKKYLKILHSEMPLYQLVVKLVLQVLIVLQFNGRIWDFVHILKLSKSFPIETLIEVGFPQPDQLLKKKKKYKIFQVTRKLIYISYKNRIELDKQKGLQKCSFYIVASHIGIFSNFFTYIIFGICTYGNKPMDID